MRRGKLARLSLVLLAHAKIALDTANRRRALVQPALRYNNAAPLALLGGREKRMKLGFFTMPVHPPARSYAETLKEDREAFILADRLGYSEGYCGEHLTDAAENIPNSMMF